MISSLLLLCILHENTTFESIVSDTKHHSNPEVLQLEPCCALGCGHHPSFKCFDDNPLPQICFSRRLRLRLRQSFVAASRPRQHRCSRLAAPMSEKKMPEPPGTYRCHCDVLWHLHPSHLKVLSIWLLFDIVNSKWGAAAEGEMAGGSYETWLLIKSDMILIYWMQHWWDFAFHD